MSDARLRSYLSSGLRKDFMPFVFSIQGWENQPKIIELLSFLSNRKVLIKKVTSSNKFSSKSEDVLYVNDHR